MASALHLYEDNRIHSAWKVLPNGNYKGMPIVEELPEGNLPDYKYIDGQFIYDPLPKVEENIDNTPSQSDIFEAQLMYTAMMTGTLLKGGNE